MEHLDRAGITSYFQKIICGDMVEHGKPAPDIYLKACEELGAAPGQALAVEDSFNGIRSAYAAGLYTVMVPDQLPPTEEILALVDKKCDSLTELQHSCRSFWRYVGTEDHSTAAWNHRTLQQSQEGSRLIT